MNVYTVVRNYNVMLKPPKTFIYNRTCLRWPSRLNHTKSTNKVINCILQVCKTKPNIPRSRPKTVKIQNDLGVFNLKRACKQKINKTTVVSVKIDI
jgi:hypothetical protein